MSGGFHVDPDVLQSHALSVNNVADTVGEAGTAAAQEFFGGMVYGVLFDALAVPPLALWANHINSTIASVATVGHSIAGALQSNAETYAGVENSTKTYVAKSGQEG
jgi:hypothetical protein